MQPIKILITEDEILIAREIEIALQDLGYTVVGLASDGEAALAKVAETKPDLVLMDVVIQGEQDGIETAQRIRDQFQIPIIFLTAYADANTLQRAKITEPFGYVLKPFQPQELNITIQVALVRHRTEQLKLETLRNNISLSLPHEVNTPLHGLLGFTDLLLRYYDSMSKTEVIETLQCMRNSVLGLERICQNFLLYAKLEVLASQPQSLAQLRQSATYVTQDIIVSCAEKQASLFNRPADLSLDLADLAVAMSEVYFRKMLEELLNNAFKFSEPQSVVSIKTDTQDQTFRLMITDQGMGMSADQIGQIGAYMQFGRDELEQPGIGLGLALVKRLVELHSGNLTITSAIGERTVVVVKLPMPERIHSPLSLPLEGED
jgi:two-component system, sensor histidine kinase and response regulator